MKGNKKTAQSRIKISEDVIITVARLAALDVKGVAGLDGEINAISKLKKNSPIIITSMGDVVAVDIKIIITGSAKACSTAQAVQAAVKENIQNMTGVAVARVNVTVNGVVFD